MLSDADMYGRSSRWPHNAMNAMTKLNPAWVLGEPKALKTEVWSKRMHSWTTPVP